MGETPEKPHIIGYKTLEYYSKYSVNACKIHSMIYQVLWLDSNSWW